MSISRYSTIQSEPPQPTVEGDDQFVGVNYKLDRGQLTNGYYAAAINKRCATGVAETRGGTVTPVGANPSELAAGVLGSGVYSNPNGEEVILLADPTEVVLVRDGSASSTVPIPTGMTLALPAAGQIEFSQQSSQVFLHRGVELPSLIWDGVSVDGFEVVTKSDPLDTSTVLIPNLPWSVNIADRAWFPIDNNTLGATDIADYTSYDRILSAYPVGTGKADKLISAFPFAESQLVIGRSRSIGLLANVFGDLSTVTGQIVSNNIGTAARRTWKMDGADALFLADSSHPGVYRIQQVATDRIAVSALPVGAYSDDKGNVVDPMEPMFKRINWKYADRSVATILDSYYYLAVPLDEATTPNVIFVFNRIKGKWEGHDEWAAGASMQFDNLLLANYLCEAHVIAINHLAKAVHILNEGLSDCMAAAEFQISDLLETRGYSTLGWNATTKRDSLRMETLVQTWHPSMSVTMILDGVEAERSLTPTPITRDRTRYRLFGRAPWDPTNVNDDFDRAGREDYSIAPGDTGIYEGTEGGIDPDRRQESVLDFSLKARGRWVAFRIENTQGRCDVGGVLVKTRGDAMTYRRAA